MISVKISTTSQILEALLNNNKKPPLNNLWKSSKNRRLTASLRAYRSSNNSTRKV